MKFFNPFNFSTKKIVINAEDVQWSFCLKYQTGRIVSEAEASEIVQTIMRNPITARRYAWVVVDGRTLTETPALTWVEEILGDDGIVL